MSFRQERHRWQKFLFLTSWTIKVFFGQLDKADIAYTTDTSVNSNDAYIPDIAHSLDCPDSADGSDRAVDIPSLILPFP